jgi:hypothetical protein
VLAALPFDQEPPKAEPAFLVLRDTSRVGSRAVVALPEQRSGRRTKESREPPSRTVYDGRFGSMLSIQARAGYGS